MWVTIAVQRALLLPGGVIQATDTDTTQVAKGCGRGCCLQVLVAITALALLAVLAGSASLISWPSTVDPGLITAGTLVVWALLVVPGALLMGLFSVERRGRRLDDIFASMGLRGRRYLLTSRQFHGSVQEREVDAYISKGPLVEIYVTSDLKTRACVGIMGGKFIGALREATRHKMRELTLQAPHWSGYQAYTLDEPWSKALSEHERAREIIQDLLSEGGPRSMRWVHFAPGAIVFRSHRVSGLLMDEANVGRWIRGLIELASIAEGLAEPSTVIEATSFESQARTNRDPIVRLVIALTWGCFGLLLLALVPMIWFFVWKSGV
jgi:hypothetical protein